MSDLPSDSDRDATVDGIETDAQMPDDGDLTGRRVGSYRIEGLIRRGGMGAVYLAARDDGEFNKHVAVKVVRPSLATPDRLQRFRKERQILAEIEHPSIARLLDGGTTEDGMPYFVMEFVPGETLADAIKRGPLEVEAALRLAQTLATVLEALHKAGVVLRDLTPSNVMLMPTGEAKVLDFGIAKEMTEPEDEDDSTTAVTQPGSIVGSPAYMSPEQAVGGVVGPPSDVFAFGVLLSEALAGELPFEGETRGTYAQNLVRARPRKLPPHVPEAVRDVVRKCLEKEPEDRYPSAVELKAALNEVAQPWAPAAAPGAMPGQPLRWAITGVVLVAAALFAWNWWGGEELTPAFPDAPVPVATTAWGEYQPRISPDGRWVSYLGDLGGEEGLWIREDGADPRRLETEGTELMGHVWAPDSRRVAYLARMVAGAALRVTSIDGSAEDSFFRLDRNVEIVRWIGSGIYLLSDDSLWHFNLDQEQLTEVTNRRGDLRLYSADVSADETRAVFSAELDGLSSLWVAGLDGSNPRRLTTDRTDPRSVRWLGESGERAVFISNEGGQVDLWEINVDTGTRRRLTFSRVAEGHPAASASGDRIVFGVSTQGANLATIDPAEPSPRARVVTSDSLNDLLPSASADGTSVAFQRSSTRYAAGSAIEGTVQLARGRGFDDPVELAEGLAPEVSADGRYVAYLVRLEHGLAQLRIHDTNTGVDTVISEEYLRAASNPFPLGWTSTNGQWSLESPEFYFALEVAPEEHGIGLVRMGDGGEPAFVTVLNLPPDASLEGLAVAHGRGDVAFVLDLEREGRTEVQLLRRSGAVETILTAPYGTEFEFAGWLASGELVVARPEAASPEVLEVLVRSPEGAWTRAGGFAYPALAFGSLSLDPFAGHLYSVRAANGLHSLYSFSIDEGVERVVVPGEVPGQTISGIRVVADGTLLFSIQNRNRDVWSISMER